MKKMNDLRYFFLTLLLFCCITSCTKDTEPAASTQSSIFMKYKLNGVLQDCTGSFDSLVLKDKGVAARKEGLPFDSGKVYDLTGQSDRNTELKFRLYADTMQLKKYVFNTELGYNYVALKLFEGGSYKIFYPYRAKADSVILNISRYSNSTIDGTFSGRLSSFDQVNTYQTVTITEGEFKNVPVFYY